MYTLSSKRKHNSKQKAIRHKNKLAKTKSNDVFFKDPYVKGKIRKLNDALDSDPVNIELLRKLMVTRGGCVTNDIRCKVWPKLLNINIFDMPQRNKNAELENKDFRNNKWWRQVNLDVDRSHRRFPTETRVSRKRVLQQQLTSTIMRVLCRNPDLNYYQGYHDLAVTLLRVLGEDLASATLEKLSRTHICDFMDTNMNRTSKMLSLFYAIMGKVDNELERFLNMADVGTIFALSWLITWYGHDINGFDIIVRLCDLFLAHHPVMPVYLAVVLVKSHREKVLAQECEMPFVHHCLQRLPTYIDEDDLEVLITNAYDLYQTHPPDSLKSEVRKYIRESDSITHHANLIYESYNQRPDSVLRRRKKMGRFFPDLPMNQPRGVLVRTTSDENGLIKPQVNPIVKVAVWTMTLSMGVMTFLVLNTSKYWI